MIAGERKEENMKKFTRFFYLSKLLMFKVISLKRCMSWKKRKERRKEEEKVDEVR